MAKKILSVVLALTMIFTVLCIGTNAEEPEGVSYQVEATFDLNSKVTTSALSSGLKIEFKPSEEAQIGALDGASADFESEQEYIGMNYDGVYYFYSCSEKWLENFKANGGYALGTEFTAEQVAVYTATGKMVFGSEEFMEVFSITVSEYADKLLAELDSALTSADKDMLTAALSYAAELKGAAEYTDIPESVKTELADAEKAADELIKKEDASYDEAEEALNNIESAIAATENAMKPQVEQLNDRLSALLSEDSKIRANELFVTLEDSDTLLAALNEKKAAADTADKTDVEQLTAAINDLSAILDEINGKLSLPTKYQALNSAIKAADVIKTDSKYADADSAAKSKFEAAYDNAVKVRDNTNAAEADIVSATEALLAENTAMTNEFKSDIELLTEKLSKAQDEKFGSLQNKQYYAAVQSETVEIAKQKDTLITRLKSIIAERNRLENKDGEDPVFTVNSRFFSGISVVACYNLVFKSDRAFGDFKYTATLDGFSAPPVVEGLGDILGDVTDSIPLPTQFTATGKVENFPSVESAEIIDTPHKQEYTDVEKFDASGLKFNVTLSNGEEGTVSYGETSYDVISFMPSDDERLTAGASEVAVFLEGKMYTHIPVSVSHSFTDKPVQIASKIGSVDSEGSIIVPFGHHAKICEGCGELDTSCTFSNGQHYEDCIPDGNWIANDDATFTNDGTSTCHCTECGGELTKIDFRSAQYNITFSNMHFLLVIFDYIATLLRGILVITK